MRSLSGLLIFWLFSTGCAGGDAPAADQESAGTDIHLFERTPDGVTYLKQATDRDGYDNQPSFTADGAWILFSSDRAGQMDTYAYAIVSGETQRVTESVEGEYSPKQMPGGQGAISVVRMDTLGVQELWAYSLADSGQTQRLTPVDRVGYYTWVGLDHLLFYRLGDPPTLQMVTVGAEDTTIVDSPVGRSIQRIPGEQASSYVHEDSLRDIRRYDWQSGDISGIIVPIGMGTDHAWTPDGSILMASGSELWGYRPGYSVDWELVTDLGVPGASRMAVSPDGRLLAVVAERLP